MDRFWDWISQWTIQDVFGLLVVECILIILIYYGVV